MRVPGLLTSEVLRRLRESSRADGCHGIPPIPSEPQHIPRQSVGRIAASSLQHLHESGEIEAERSANDDMNMGLEEGELDNFRSFLDRGAPDERLEELARWRINHRPTAECAPGQVKVQSMSGHSGADTDTL